LKYSYCGRQESLRVLEAAFDNGITHFDVARLYSDGEAEAVVGSFIRGRRDKVVLVSKAGILPLKQTFYHKLNRKVRTVAKSNAPGLTGWLSPAIYEPIFGRFSPKDIRDSVETSLRKLRTDYLDALLLHECKHSNIVSFEVVAILEKLQLEGKILSYGLATDVKETSSIAKSFPTLASIAQIPSKEFNVSAWPFLRDKNRFVITHSVLSKDLDPIASRLRGQSANWIRSKFDFDLSKPSGVAQLLLLRAIQANSSGMVLFSTSKPEHTQQCVDAVRMAKAHLGEAQAITDFLSSLPDR
jgi:D-threo-aldose 1-dehydrogenase